MDLQELFLHSKDTNLWVVTYIINSNCYLYYKFPTAFFPPYVVQLWGSFAVKRSFFIFRVLNFKSISGFQVLFFHNINHFPI
jgi:hypothetical protein